MTNSTPIVWVNNTLLFLVRARERHHPVLKSHPVRTRSLLFPQTMYEEGLMSNNISQNAQHVHPNEKDIQAEHKAKGRLSLLSYPQWTRPKKWITKRKEHPENPEMVNPKKANYNE